MPMSKRKVKKELITRQDLGKLSHAYQVRFALFCAYQVKPHWEKIPECVKAIEITEKWLVGEATAEECRVAALAAAATANIDTTYNTAYDAAYDAAHAAYVAYAAAQAASAATYATYAAYAASKNRQKLIDEQWDFYNDLLNIDKRLEDAIGLEKVV